MSPITYTNLLLLTRVSYYLHVSPITNTCLLLLTRVSYYLHVSPISNTYLLLLTRVSYYLHVSPITNTCLLLLTRVSFIYMCLLLLTRISYYLHQPHTRVLSQNQCVPMSDTFRRNVHHRAQHNTTQLHSPFLSERKSTRLVKLLVVSEPFCLTSPWVLLGLLSLRKNLVFWCFPLLLSKFLTKGLKVIIFPPLDGRLFFFFLPFPTSMDRQLLTTPTELQGSVSQPPERNPVPVPGINYTGPRKVLLEFVILVFSAIFMNKCFIVEIFWGEKIFVNVSKNSDPDVGLRKLQYATRFH